MIKKILISAILALIALPVQADTPRSLDEVLLEIKQSQNVSNAKDIKCDQISDEQFEELGDAVMETMMPGRQHEVADQMMGGEGSESLKSAHVAMGVQHLGCGSAAGGSFNGNMPMAGMMNMMGGGLSMMGLNNLWRGGGASMMGNWGTGFGAGWMIGGWILMILFWAIIIIGIVALVKWLMTSGRGGVPAEKSALDILKERFARGEIDVKEFEERSKMLR